MSEQDERVREIEERAQKATAGPWEARRRTYGGEPDCREVYQTGTTLAITGWGRVIQDPPDAEFIAHARSDVPYLITQLREAQELLKAMEASSAFQIGSAVINGHSKPPDTDEDDLPMGREDR